MVEEAKDMSGEDVITPPGRHRPEGMAVDVPEGVDYPQGVNPEGKVAPAADDNVNEGETGGSEGGLHVPGTV
jgi:hypothetical protein